MSGVAAARLEGLHTSLVQREDSVRDSGIEGRIVFHAFNFGSVPLSA